MQRSPSFAYRVHGGPPLGQDSEASGIVHELGHVLGAGWVDAEALDEWFCEQGHQIKDYLVWEKLHEGLQIELRVTVGEESVCSLKGVDSMFRRRLLSIPPNDANAFAMHTLIRQSADSVLIESGDSTVSVQTNWSMVADLFRESLVESETRYWLKQALGLLGMLDGPVSQLPAIGKYWEFHSRLFHRFSSTDGTPYPSGGTFPHMGSEPVAPVFKPPMTDNILRLAKPPKKLKLQLATGLDDVLGSRRSLRPQKPSPLTATELGALLHASFYPLRLIDHEPTSPSSYEASKRPYPSGGGMHPLELYLLVSQPGQHGLPNGLYHYRLREHLLEALPSNEAELSKLARATIADWPVSITLFATARLGRTGWKYEAVTFRLIYAEWGALLQTLHLNATALGLSLSGLGSLPASLFSRVSQVDYNAEPLIGLAALCGPASETTSK